MSSPNTWPKIVAVLMEKPMTREEISEATGVHRVTVGVVVKMLHQHGLAYVADMHKRPGDRSHSQQRFYMQTTPFEMKDTTTKKARHD